MPLGNLMKLVDGFYTYKRRGLSTELFPDLKPDKGGLRGWISFKQGSLSGDAEVAWRGETLGEEGVEIIVDLKGTYFIDQITLHQVPEEKRGVLEYGLASISVYGGKEKGQMRLMEWTGDGVNPISSDKVSLKIGAEASFLIIHITSFNRNLTLNGLEIWGSSRDSLAIFPIPQEIRIKEGTFQISSLSRIVLSEKPSKDTMFAANLLSEKLGKRSLKIKVSRIKTPEELKNCLFIGKPSEFEIEKGKIRPEGYFIKVDRDKVLLAALDRRGLIYGVEAFLQLLSFYMKTGKMPCCEILDYPRSSVRGVHLFIPPRKSIPFFKRLIKYVLAPMRMNTIFIQVTAGMKFDRRPEINEAWVKANEIARRGLAPPVPHGEVGGGRYISKDEVREIVKYAREYGFEIIPEIQSLSHVTYLTLAYPEIAEDRGEISEIAPYSHCYCPLHPEVYKIVFDMIDEVVEVFKPLRYVHMGHDEVYALGICNRCKDKNRAELFANDVKKIYDYLKRKGLGMMIWADMLHPFMSYSTPEAIDMIPKDIILLDFVWYFRTWEDIEDRLLKKGFKVIMGNLYSSHYPRFNKRISKKGVIGGEVSTWCKLDEYSLGRKGKIFDFIYTANMLWSSHYVEKLRWSFTNRISEMLRSIKSELSGLSYPSLSENSIFEPINLEEQYNSSLLDLSGCRGSYDFSSLPRGLINLRGVLFKIGDGLIGVEGNLVRDKVFPSSIEIPINGRFDSFVFLHAATYREGFRKPFIGRSEKRRKLGYYEVIYEDCSSEEIPIEYGWNIAEWSKKYGEPAISLVNRHAGYYTTYGALPFYEGKTHDGRNVTLYGYEWVNPSPKKGLRAIKINASDTSDLAILLIALTGVKLTDSLKETRKQQNDRTI